MEYNIDESKRKEIMEYINYRRHKGDYAVTNKPGIKTREIIEETAEKFDVPFEYVKEMVMPSNDKEQA
ncbi:MAG: hypothetical protein J1E62_09310 [Lachnospiraceae bacterium]|nr:hypothetical protein [Lachnospiraceae bacterium]